jgi:hypothetical protein
MFAYFWSRLGAYDESSAASRERFARKYRRSHESIRPPKGAEVERDTKRETFRTLYAQDAAYEEQAAIHRAAQAHGATIIDADHTADFTRKGIITIGPIGAIVNAAFVTFYDLDALFASVDRAA